MKLFFVPKNQIRALLTLLFIFIYSNIAFSSDIVVTKIITIPKNTEKLESYKAQITFNGAVEVSEIRVLRNQQGELTIKLPEYVSKRGAAYPLVLLETKQAKEALSLAVLTGKPNQVFKKIESYGIAKFYKYSKESKLKAFAIVRLNYAVDIECKIFQNKNGPWVSWPEIKDQQTNKWVKVVVIQNTKLRSSIESLLLKKFKATKAGAGTFSE